jgi:hypothetical protein
MPRRLPFIRSFMCSAAIVALGACLAVNAVGCKSQSAAEESLPPQKTALLHQADQMQNQGEDLKNQGMKLRAEGKGGDDLIKQGEQKLTEAEKLREKAMTLKE